LDYLLKKNSKYIKEKYECAKDIDFKTFSFQFRNSIEHFYPRHYQGKEPPEWVEDFGNLALLTTGTNIEIQNSLPIDKAIYFKRNNFQKYSLKLQIMSLITINKEDWQETEIKQFRNDMIEILNNDLAKLNM